MAVNIITLSKEGVIKDAATRIDWLMQCFFFSKHSQSQLFRDHIISLPKIIQKNIDNPELVRDDLHLQLTTLLNRFFSQVRVNVDVEELDNSSRIVLDLSVSDDDSNTGLISVGYSLTYESSNLVSIIESYTGRNLMER